MPPTNTFCQPLLQAPPACNSSRRSCLPRRRSHSPQSPPFTSACPWFRARAFRRALRRLDTKCGPPCAPTGKFGPSSNTSTLRSCQSNSRPSTWWASQFSGTATSASWSSCTSVPPWRMNSPIMERRWWFQTWSEVAAHTPFSPATTKREPYRGPKMLTLSPKKRHNLPDRNLQRKRTARSKRRPKSSRRKTKWSSLPWRRSSKWRKRWPKRSRKPFWRWSLNDTKSVKRPSWVPLRSRRKLFSKRSSCNKSWLKTWKSPPKRHKMLRVFSLMHLRVLCPTAKSPLD